MLSHPLPIFALVGHYPTNKLIGRGPIPRRNLTFGPETLSGITAGFPTLSRIRGQVSTRYSPLRRCPSLKSAEASINKFSLDLHA